MTDITRPRADETVTDDRGYFTRPWFAFLSVVADVVAGKRAPTIPSVTMDSLPPAAGSKNSVIIITDEAGGPTLAWCDGAQWRRASDNATVGA